MKFNQAYFKLILILIGLNLLSLTISINLIEPLNIKSIEKILYLDILISSIVTIFGVSLLYRRYITSPKREILSQIELENFKSISKESSEFKEIYNSFRDYIQKLHLELKSLKESKEFLKNVTDATRDMIFYKDRELKYIGCNRAFSTLYQVDETYIVGKSSTEIISDKSTIERVKEQDRWVLNGGSVNDYRWVEFPNRESAYLNIQKFPIKRESGEVVGIVGVARDVTIQKRIQKELEQFNQELGDKIYKKTQELHNANKLLKYKIEEISERNRELNEAKDEIERALKTRDIFISNISHELRTPLNSIINFTEQIVDDFDDMLNDRELQRDSKDFLERVLRNSKHLLSLINDILDFSKFKSGKIEYDLEYINLEDTIENIYYNLSSLANKKDIKFKLNLTKERHIVELDRKRFSQILINLISNAIKFTNRGFIEVRVKDMYNFLTVEIEDSGVGIAKDKLDIIFEPFKQINKQDKGTGLGLAITKQMCSDMNIELRVSSEPKVGTLFSLVIKKQ